MGYKNKTGQALLIVMLAVIVLVTLVLSVVSRSVSDVSVTTRDEESLRAFYAAEAGIEETLISSIAPTEPDHPITSTIGEQSESEYEVDIEYFPENASSYNHPSKLASGETATVWFMGHNSSTGDLECTATNPCFTDSTFDICWGEDGTSNNSATTPALEIKVYYEDTGGNLNSINTTVDPNNNRRNNTNNFEDNSGQNCTIDNTDYQFEYTVDMADMGVPDFSEGSLKFAIVKMLYNQSIPHPIGFSATNNFPAQGTVIESTGSSGDAIRRVEVTTLYPELPSTFTDTIFSPPGITQ